MPPELIETLYTLHLVRLRFYAAISGRLELPPLPGATLHGLLGAALAREACTCGAVSWMPGSRPRTLPPISVHGADCLFRQLFRPVVPAATARALGFGGEGEGGTGAPAPHVLRPPLGQRVLEPGDRLAFDVILVGRAATGEAVRAGENHAVRHWVRVVRAVGQGLGEHEGGQGVGRDRVPCPLVEVCDGAGRPLWVRGYGFVDEPAVERPAERPMPPFRGWAQLRFLTPAAIKDGGRVIDERGGTKTLSGPDPLGALSRALVRRAHALAELYCVGEGDPLVRAGAVAKVPTWLPERLGEARVSSPRPERAAIEAMGPVLFQRVEGHDIAAEIGEIHARGVPETFVRLCRIGEALGVGSNTTHGLGWFELLA